VLHRGYNFILGLPAFTGKAKIETFLRSLLKPHVSKVRHGLLMELDIEEWLQVDLRANGVLEPRTSALFEKILHPGDTYVDVGAHVGYHALLARHLVGAAGRIYAIDPQPYNCGKILANAELNGFANIVVIAAAASDSEGFVDLKNQSSRDRARLTLTGPGINDGALTFVVPKVTLAWLFKKYQFDRVELLKIDVEGFEHAVLQGAGNAIGIVKNLILEVLPDENMDSARAIEQILRAGGFRMSDVEGVEWWPGRPCVENNVWARRA
jgi:FkbM family methyltransferase